MGTRTRDALDRNLIALLERDARETTVGLARRLGVARTTVKERISRLERDGVIEGYAAIIRPEPEISGMQAMIYIRCQRPRLEDVVRGLRQFPEIASCQTLAGPHDLVCTVEVPQSEDLEALVDEIAALQGMTDVTATVVLSTKFRKAVVPHLSSS